MKKSVDYGWRFLVLVVVVSFASGFLWLQWIGRFEYVHTSGMASALAVLQTCLVTLVVLGLHKLGGAARFAALIVLGQSASVLANWISIWIFDELRASGALATLLGDPFGDKSFVIWSAPMILLGGVQTVAIDVLSRVGVQLLESKVTKGNDKERNKDTHYPQRK